MKFKNNTKESYTDLKGCYEHTVILKLKDGTYRAIHIQDGCDNLGIQVRILGNSITEMKAFYRTYYCKI